MEVSQGSLPGRGGRSAKKLSRSWLDKGREQGIPHKGKSISRGQKVRYNGADVCVCVCVVLGFGEEMLS